MTASGAAPGEPGKPGRVSIQYLIDLRPPSDFLPTLLRRHLRVARPHGDAVRFRGSRTHRILAPTKLDLPFLRAATTPSTFLT
ncbi:hypothetical protein D3C72_1551240 [compost metagenome]